MKASINVGMSPITKIEEEYLGKFGLYVIKDTSCPSYVRKIYGNVISVSVGATDGFLFIKDYKGKCTTVNPAFIITIDMVNLTKVKISHTNTGFPHRRFSEVYSHALDTELRFFASGGCDKKDVSLDFELKIVESELYSKKS